MKYPERQSKNEVVCDNIYKLFLRGTSFIMFMTRRTIREKTVFSVYDALIYESLHMDFDAKMILCGAFMCKFKDIDPVYVDVFAKALLNQDEIKNRVNEYLINWSFDRLSWISKAIFMVSYSETVLVKAVPLEISINEAIEIARKYVDDAETKYLNAVLNKVLHNALGDVIDNEKVEVDVKEMEVPSENEIKEIVNQAIDVQKEPLGGLKAPFDAEKSKYINTSDADIKDDGKEGED